MVRILLVIATGLALIGCSSSTTNPAGTKTVTVTAPEAAAKASPSPGSSKGFTPAKPMKCTYDTDCMVQNSCVKDKCKLTGTECRFRSDCPSPRGQCVSNVCQFH